MPMGLPLGRVCTWLVISPTAGVAIDTSPRAAEQWQMSDAVSEDVVWPNQEQILPQKRILQSIGSGPSLYTAENACSHRES